MHSSRQWKSFSLLSSALLWRIFYFSPAGMFLFQGEVRRRHSAEESVSGLRGVAQPVEAALPSLPPWEPPSRPSRKHTHTHTRLALISQKATRIFRQHTHSRYHNNRADNADRSPTNPTFKSTKTTMRKMQARKPAKCLTWCNMNLINLRRNRLRSDTLVWRMRKRSEKGYAHNYLNIHFYYFKI